MLERLRLKSLLLLLVCPVYGQRFPSPEKLTYQVEWRLINAGTATVQLLRETPESWKFHLSIESAGLVSRLYRVSDTYHVSTSDRFCASSVTLDAQEGKRHNASKFTIDSKTRKLTFEERDLVRNHTETKTLDTPSCTYDIVGALAAARTLHLEPGKSVVLPITDGKKIGQTRIEAQSRDKLTVNGKSYNTVRSEAFVFDNVLYKRHGRLLMWMTDDSERLPVQFRLLIGFPIGTITVSLQKVE